MINAFTWCVGIKKEFEVEIATVIANIAGSPPEAIAIDTANGTNNTVAPTLDIINVNIVARIAIPT